jgi:hypothetical protein
MKSKYLQVIGKRTNSRAIYNLAIAVSITMRPSGNGAYLEIIYDLENPKKNVRIFYSFSEEGQEELYKQHQSEITTLIQEDKDFLKLDFPQL